MAKSLNKVQLIGHIGKDPVMKYTGQGVPCANFSVATNERTKVNGEFVEKTEWHNVLAWQKLAEVVGEYAKKGSQVYVEGRLQTSSWDDRESGQKRYRTEIVASTVLLLGRAPTETQSNYSHAEHVSDEQVAAGVGAAIPRSNSNLGITDEDLPF